MLYKSTEFNDSLRRFVEIEIKIRLILQDEAPPQEITICYMLACVAFSLQSMDTDVCLYDISVLRAGPDVYIYIYIYISYYYFIGVTVAMEFVTD
jgi:hypothetical protein